MNCLGKGKSDSPLLWWCAPDTASSSAESCEVETSFDGILTPSMTGSEIHWTLHFAARRYMERKQWEQERKQLQSRLEDRKWIDMAKAILSDLKQISEAEAYDLLRKKAMDERKTNGRCSHSDCEGPSTAPNNWKEDAPWICLRYSER